MPGSVDVLGLRESLGLTQLEFATRFGLDLDAVQNWEQGRTRPDRNARILLRVIATAPSAVEEALVRITPENLAGRRRLCAAWSGDAVRSVLTGRSCTLHAT